MDVALGESAGELPGDATAPGPPGARGARLLEPDEIAVILDGCRRREMRIARGFRECRGLSPQQLEEVYQETSIELLRRDYSSEEHVRRSLRVGIKGRARNLRRDERRREEIYTESAPAIHAAGQARGAQEAPEQLVLARQDRLLITEFLAELSEFEREVFWHTVEGLGYNGIATLLGEPANKVRSAVASCERKREIFQKLHDSGRLCGYRAATIKALLEGQATTLELVQQAVVHVEGCAHCRAEHKTNAQRLRRAFEQQAAALIPTTLTSHLGLLSHASSHSRTLAQRLRPDWLQVGQGGLRERAVALLAGGGASAKLTAGIVTAAVIAGASVTATHALGHEHHQQPHRRVVAAARPAHTSRPIAAAPPTAPPILTVVSRTQHDGSRRHHHARGRAAVAHSASSTSSNEPGGFAYLGVPAATKTTPAPETTRADTQTGGAFSP
jgi:RNA polymerase sigma factor (sigma-70 family)